MHRRAPRVSAALVSTRANPPTARRLRQHHREQVLALGAQRAPDHSRVGACRAAREDVVLLLHHRTHAPCVSTACAQYTCRAPLLRAAPSEPWRKRGSRSAAGTAAPCCACRRTRCCGGCPAGWLAAPVIGEERELVTPCRQKTTARERARAIATTHGQVRQAVAARVGALGEGGAAHDGAALRRQAALVQRAERAGRQRFVAAAGLAGAGGCGARAAQPPPGRACAGARRPPSAAAAAPALAGLDVAGGAAGAREHSLARGRG